MGNQQSTVLPPQSAGKMELTVNNVCDVLKTAGFSAGDWKELASRLEPKPRNIDTGAIQFTHQGDAYKCLREAIRVWLQTDQGRSWTKLAEAVKKVHGYGDVTADSIIAQSDQSMPMPKKLIQNVKTNGPSPKSFLPEAVSSDTQGKEIVCFPFEAAESKELDLSTLFSESTEIEAIYGRLMMIGHAGAGKTSLQLALMNKELPPNLSSTPLATAKSVKCQWTYAGEEAGQHWNEMTEDDEVLELAAFLSKSVSPEAFPQLIASLRNYTKDVATTAQVTPVRKGVLTINHTMVQQVLKKLMKEVLHKLTNESSVQPANTKASKSEHTMVQQVLKKLMKEVLFKLTSESPAQPANTKASKSDVLLHLWDMGCHV